MSFEDLLGQESAGGEILGEEMDKASVLAKDFPFLSTELLRELEELQVSRRFLHFRVSAHNRGSTVFHNPPFGELSLRPIMSSCSVASNHSGFYSLGLFDIFLSLLYGRLLHPDQ
jgi:hypothetical protein